MKTIYCILAIFTLLLFIQLSTAQMIKQSETGSVTLGSNVKKYEKYIKFKKPFKQIPQIFPWVTRLETSNKFANYDLKIKNVTKNGFKIELRILNKQFKVKEMTYNYVAFVDEYEYIQVREVNLKFDWPKQISSADQVLSKKIKYANEMNDGVRPGLSVTGLRTKTGDTKQAFRLKSQGAKYTGKDFTLGFLAYKNNPYYQMQLYYLTFPQGSAWHWQYPNLNCPDSGFWCDRFCTPKKRGGNKKSNRSYGTGNRDKEGTSVPMLPITGMNMSKWARLEAMVTSYKYYKQYKQTSIGFKINTWGDTEVHKMGFQLNGFTISKQGGVGTAGVKPKSIGKKIVQPKPAQQKFNEKCAYLFKECDYQGEKVEICPKTKKMNINWIVKSIYVPKGHILTIFNEHNYKGKKLTYKRSLKCIKNFSFRTSKLLGIKILNMENKKDKKTYAVLD